MEDGSSDGNAIHGSGHPWISGPVGTGMECILCPWTSQADIHELKGWTCIYFLLHGCPFDRWDPHASDSNYINNPNHTSSKSRGAEII